MLRGICDKDFSVSRIKNKIINFDENDSNISRKFLKFSKEGEREREREREKEREREREKQRKVNR